MGRHVLGIDGERTAIGRDRLLEMLPTLGALDGLDPCTSVLRQSELVDDLVIDAEVELRSGTLVARTDSKLLIASSSSPLPALIWPVSQLITQGAAGSLWVRRIRVRPGPRGFAPPSDRRGPG